MEGKISFKHTLLLLLSAAIWGFAFVAQKDGMSFVEPFCFNAIRFLMGAILLSVIFFKKFVQLSKKEIIAGTVLGIFLFLGSSFQQAGIQSTQAGNAGFITSLYIVFIPIVGIFFKKKTASYIWLAILFSLFGFSLLSLDFKTFTISYGDFLVFVGSICWAVHVSFIEHYATLSKSIELAIVQFFVCSILSFGSTVVFEQSHFPSTFRAWIPLLYAGIFSAGIAFTVQLYAQRFVPANIAGIILSSESVFALLGGMLILNEQLINKQWLGVASILIAIVFVQWYPLIKIKSYAVN